MAMNRRIFLPLLLLCIGVGMVLTLNSCGGGSDEDEARLPEVGADASAIEKYRAEKDKEFKYGTNSPIPQAMRKAFAGLSYFKHDDKFVVLASFEPAEKPDTVKIPASKGEVRSMLRVGTFSFSIGDNETVHTLQAYREVGEKSTSMLVLFKDKTTGRESYDAGRYLDIEETGDEEYTLDFNMAYNPYCAYNEEYSCPLVPPQNVLAVAINAGEKKFTLSHTKEGAKR